MKKVAILIDGGFLQKVKYPKEREFKGDVIELSKKCLVENEEIFRIYYYDCLPFGGTKVHPITLQKIDFSNTEQFRKRNDFISELSKKNHIAFRGGELSCHGWCLKESVMVELIKKPRTITKEDIYPDMEQKGVDIKIGLDIAWLSSKRIVDRIILITGDSDFIPAMKFARREGMQVILIKLRKEIKKGLIVHSDEVREITV